MPDPTCPYCGTPAATHPATTCLSAWAADRVMGIPVCTDVNCEGCAAKFRVDPKTGNLFAPFDDPRDYWHPHGNIAAAFELLTDWRGWEIESSFESPDYFAVEIPTGQQGEEDFEYQRATGDTLPLAICRAAILAAEKETIDAE